MKRKIISILLLTICTIFMFSACTPFEDKIKQPELKYSTQYPQSQAEYKLAINSDIVQFTGLLQVHISNGNGLLNGKYTTDAELATVKNTITTLKGLYEKDCLIYPPDVMKSAHSNTLLSLNKAINAVEVYEEMLEKCKDGTISDPTVKSEIQASIGIMQTEYSNLTSTFSIK